MAPKKETEATIQTAILKYLRKEGYFCWRNNNAATYDSKMNNGRGGYRASPYLLKGVPDIIMIGEHGTFIGFEVKGPNGKPSPEQILFKKRCESQCAEYHIVRSVEEVVECLSTKKPLI